MSASWCRRRAWHFNKTLKLQTDCTPFFNTSNRYLCSVYSKHTYCSFSISLCCTSQTLLYGKQREHQTPKNRFYSNSVVYDGNTKPGEKKDTNIELPKRSEPKFTEAAWYDWWVKKGFFKPEYRAPNSQGDEDKPRETFSMCLPPPNVTGKLHMGHALTNSVQDALVRWNRMKGKETLWLPGYDHAGIATQVVVEKMLLKEEGKTRHDIGREEFIKRVWEWKEKNGDTIFNQMKRLGSSLDWDRTCFTMDEKLSEAVAEAFVKLHDEGLIKRKKKLVNWSCHLKSSMSDLEVEYLELTKKSLLEIPGYKEPIPFGTLYEIEYQIKQFKSGKGLKVATSRPETIFGDTALAVNPNSIPHRRFIGLSAINPLTGREIPVIGDESVNSVFATGIVKVTPAHDHNDFAIAQRHNLPLISVINEDGLMENVPKNYMGMKRYDARRAVIHSLSLKDGSGYYKMSLKVSPIKIPCCSRSGDIIEPLLKEQWYLDCQEMNRIAIEAVQTKQLELIPSYYEKVWYDFLSHEKSEDWCLSRQVWWGHKIPVYLAKIKNEEKEGVWVAGRSHDEALEKAAKKIGVEPNSITLEQDNDVLDTWFSSALFPFSALGWPEKTADLKEFYPNSLMETGFDIIFFWVARMVMFGQKLTGQLPFKKVLLHGVITDKLGHKMSKSKGNTMDPMHIIDGVKREVILQEGMTSNLSTEAMRNLECMYPDDIRGFGADSMRLQLLSLDTTNQRITVNIQDFVSAHRTCTQLINISSYLKSHMDYHETKLLVLDQTLVDTNTSINDLDRWILYKHGELVKLVNECFENYRIHTAALQMRQYIKEDLRAIYLNSTKYDIRAENNTARREVVMSVLAHVFDSLLRLFSPIMPFITEELYQRQPSHLIKAESICIASYPTAKEEFHIQHTIDLDCFITNLREIVSALNHMGNEGKYPIQTNHARVHVQNAALFERMSADNFRNSLTSFIGCKSLELTSEPYTSEDLQIIAANLHGIVVTFPFIPSEMQNFRALRLISFHKSRIKKAEDFIDLNMKKFNYGSRAEDEHIQVIEETEMMIKTAQGQIASILPTLKYLDQHEKNKKKIKE